MKKRRSKVDPRDRVGAQTYNDCHFGNHPDETLLVCATWANHIDIGIGEVRPSNRRNNLKLGVDLDESSVKRLHEQMGAWLRHRREERDEEDPVRAGGQ